jgi:dUTP pyrophosphatase
MKKMDKVKIKVKVLRNNVTIPTIMKKGDVGADAYISKISKIDRMNKRLMDIPNSEYHLEPFERIACHTGLAVELPEGYYMQVVPRSGFALWNGISIVNSPGTIDNGYRGEIIAIIVNISKDIMTLKVGDRICQLILRKMIQFEFDVVSKLSETERSKKGFGSTGVGSL